ncbi:hypothetical protein [Streptomyces sp. NPDC087538]|uniref:hypothetical protein n=1 Tax=Streptomyces sp. NPDC087538 TaxID=3365797 RepID=UPI0038162E26
MDTKHLAIDGYVDATPAPGTSWGTANFDLIHPSADADQVAPEAPDTIYACSTTDPRIADVLLHEIQPGDLLRVTGIVVQPDDPTAPAHFAVDALEVLEAAPAPVLYGLVLVALGELRGPVPVFTASGHWVGEAAGPDAISDLIDAWENGST